MSKHKKTISTYATHLIKTIIILTIIIGAFFLFLMIIPQPHYKDGFKTLTDLKKHAQTLDEFIKMEGPNVMFPQYERYYQKNFSPCFFKYIKGKINNLFVATHLKNKPIFSESFFKSILENVTSFREQKGWQGDFVQKIELNESSKVIVFGPVQGSFHGLIRYLEQLNNLGIIDNNLKIQKSNYFFVFLGNVVNRSPYTLEIFSIVLKLLQQNPENVIYLKGTNEAPTYWRQHTLRRELELRLSKYSESKIPLEHEVDNFFDTLPITLYCTLPYLNTEVLNYFKCAAFIEDEKFFTLIDAEHYATFLKQKSGERLSSFDLHKGNNNDPEAKKIVSRAIIRDIKKRDYYEEMNGLRLLPPTKGITTWNVLSTTAEPYRNNLNFFYDAFVIIHTHPSQKDWLITLYNRDIRNTNDTQFKEKSFYLFTGQEL